VASPHVSATAIAGKSAPPDALVHFLPRSSNPARIVKNAAVFDVALDDAQMARLTPWTRA
jgi:diketogulonate reductase-like aldo/keto reductase